MTWSPDKHGRTVWNVLSLHAVVTRIVDASGTLPAMMIDVATERSMSRRPW